MTTPQFTVALIARNEAETLPRLLGSLQEFRSRGGEVLLVDTGSTDGTPEVARRMGCRVEEVGDRFATILTQFEAVAINQSFVVPPDAPLVQAGQRFFDYASARNYAASLSRTDWVLMPDCDEVYVKLDIDKIDWVIRNSEAGRIGNTLVYRYDAAGRPEGKFSHCRCYDRRRTHWDGRIHEILAEEPPMQTLADDEMLLEHKQNPRTDRSGYVRGLAYACFLRPDNDRHSHYLGRELLFTGRHRSAIKELQRHVNLNGWAAERAHSWVLIGDARRALGEERAALDAWHEAYLTDGYRVAALLRPAQYWKDKDDPQRVLAYATAALTVPWSGYYADLQSSFRDYPHHLLYWAYHRMGNVDKAREHWRKAYDFAPEEHAPGLVFFEKTPKVSIVIPTLGRPEKLQRTLQAIQANAGYENYEVLVKQDSFEARKGVPKLVAEGVAESTGDLVMFLGNDCVPQRNFLATAVAEMKLRLPDGWGLVGLNDSNRPDDLATHWLADKRLLPLLDGEFFHTGYSHCFCDNELTERCRRLGRYWHSKDARIWHDVASCQGDDVHKLAYDPEKFAADQRLWEERMAKLGLK